MLLGPIIRALLAGLILTLAGQGALAQAASEAELKAAYLVNFLKYVEWPGERTSVAICLFGRTGLSSYLASYEGRSINGRELRMRRVATRDEAGSCQALYIPDSEEARAAEVLGWVAKAPTLTVGEGEGFIRKGGGIALMAADGRIQFEVNQEALARAGLKASSPMLRLARKIHGGTR